MGALRGGHHRHGRCLQPAAAGHPESDVVDVVPPNTDPLFCGQRPRVLTMDEGQHHRPAALNPPLPPGLLDFEIKDDDANDMLGVHHYRWLPPWKDAGFDVM